MAPIPSAELPGLKPLYDRALMALQRCEETPAIDFKRSGDWDSLKWKIIETALGMGNLRDGGIIVVGVAEDGDSWELAGISEEHLETFNVDVVLDQANSYVSPHVNLTLATIPQGDKRFLVIEVHEFNDSPLVCKKSGPPDVSKLVQGGMYVRPPGMAKTTRITNAGQMHDLLDLAAEKRARRILAVARNIGMVPGETASQKFDKELGGL